MRINIRPGMAFHRLTVVGLSHIHTQPSGSRKSIYDCVCACGNTTKVDGGNLTGRHPVKSCGCQNRDNIAHVIDHGRTHGKRRTRTYELWANVVARGTGKEQREKYYDRGIRVCDRWLKFENFYSDMGDCPEGMSIDRIDNNGSYSPGNCRWATAKQQARNTRKTWYIEVGGKKVSGAEVAEKLGMSPSTFSQRIKKLGWSVEKAISEPVKRKAIA